MKRPLQIFISDNFFCLFTRLNIRNSIWMYLGWCLLEVESNIWRHFCDRNTNTNTIFDISKIFIEICMPRKLSLPLNTFVTLLPVSFFYSFIHFFIHFFLHVIQSFDSFFHLCIFFHRAKRISSNYISQLSTIKMLILVYR